MINPDKRNASHSEIENHTDAEMIDPILFQSSLEESFSSPQTKRQDSFILSSPLTQYSSSSLKTSQQLEKPNPELSSASSGNQNTKYIEYSSNYQSYQSNEQNNVFSSENDIFQYLDFKECENKAVETSSFTKKKLDHETSDFLAPCLRNNKKLFPKTSQQEKSKYENNRKISKKVRKNKVDEKKPIKNNLDTNLVGSVIGITQFTSINNDRYEFILNQAAEKNLNLQEIESILSLLSTKVTDNSIVTHKPKLTFNISSKLEILFLICDCKNQDIMEKENCLKLKDRFPFLETSNGLLLKIRSSCTGKTSSILVEKQNKEPVSLCFIDPKWLVALNQFKIFKRVMDDNELKNKRKRKYQQEIKNYIKRPSNSFMLYRNSILKSLIILIILNTLNSLIIQYCELIFSNKNIANCISPELENLILLLIKNDLKKQKESNLPNFQNFENKILHIIFSRNEFILEDSDSDDFGSKYKKSQSIRMQLLQKFQTSIERKTKETNLASTNLNYNYGLVCYIISFLWVSESEKVKDHFRSFSEIEKNIHKEQFPNYKFNPQKK